MCNIQGCKKIWYSESNSWEFIKPSQCKKIGHAKVKQLLVQAKDEELQGRLDRLRKIIDKIDDVDNNNNNNNDDNNNNNINFYDRNDNDSNVGGEELSWRYSNLKAPLSNVEQLLRRYNDLRTPLFWDIPPWPPKRPDIEKDYNDIFLLPQLPLLKL